MSTGDPAPITGDAAIITPADAHTKRGKKDEPSPQLEEALEILADLVAANSQLALN